MSKATELETCPYCAEKVRIHAGKPVLTHRPGCRGIEIDWPSGGKLSPVEVEMPDIEHRETILISAIRSASSSWRK